MTNDHSKAQFTAPAPGAGDSTGRESNPLPQPAGTDSAPAPAPDAPDLVKTVGGTTFDIYFHFSQTSRETFTDKVVRLIQNENVASNV